MIKEKLRSLYRRIRYGIRPSFESPRYFLNNAKGCSSACFVLAGYKQFTWEIVFKRIKKFCPENVDVCIVSSGLYSQELDSYAKKYNWSYFATKRNCVTLALNSAVKAFPNMPAGCALDFGVTEDGRTLLIEMNDGYSLGTYGLEATLYARLLTARWAELNGTEDFFKNMDIESDS